VARLCAPWRHRQFRTARSRRRNPPSLRGLACSFRAFPNPWYRGHWFRDPASPLPPGPAMRSSRRFAATSDDCSTCRPPLIEFRRPPRSFHGAGLPRPLDRDASCGLRSPLARINRRGPVHSGLCLPGIFRPQGLDTLSTACSLAGPARFFRIGQRLWGSPLRSLIFAEVIRHSCRTRPACRYCRSRFDERNGSPKLGPEDRLPGTSSAKTRPNFPGRSPISYR
jgi:hypothetical protein